MDRERIEAEWDKVDYVMTVIEFAAHIAAIARNEALEEAAIRIKKADDEAVDNDDYMFDSDDCIKILNSMIT